MAKPKKNKAIFSEDFGEQDFNLEVGRCVLRVLGAKKTEPVGDRVVKFLGLFLKTASEKDTAIFQQNRDVEETQTIPETPSSRLTFSILSLLIPLLSAKEKTVRFRATQIISHVVNTLDAIDDELYHLVRQGLVKRVRDREPTIRIQAVMGLGRLAGNEAEDSQDDDDSDDMDSSGLLDRLLDVLQNDTSAEVRRSLLLNLPLTPATLPYLLERARDLDGPTRRALYARLLPTLGDFRHLSLSMREKLLRWGLRDRDENVRKAAARLFRERWIEDCARPSKDIAAGVAAQQLSSPSVSGLLELLERIDVISSGVDNGIALEAMKDFWEGRPDYLDAITFDDAFWDALTPESVFLARTFNDFCHQNPTHQGLCEQKMPEVTRLGFYLQKYTNTLLEGIRGSAELGSGDEENVEQEFIVEQLLHIAETLDYSDEIGRRKMFSLLREALAMADLPEEATRLSVEVLRLVCGTNVAGERDFCGVVLEAVAEVHDNITSSNAEGGNGEEESFLSAKSEMSGSATPTESKRSRLTPSPTTAISEEQEERAMREIMINMKCLHIAQCMLQNIDGNLQQNMHLVTMLNNLVVPAVRSHEAPIRERGLFCLGLCCLLDKTLAEENAVLFIHCFTKGHEALQTTSLKILCDMLTTHPTLLCAGENESATAPAYQKALLKSFARALKSSSPPGVQSAAAMSLSKLLLTSRLNIPQFSLDELLRSLVVAFFDPITVDNANLRQALAYFLPVYCHSRIENCSQMARIAVGVIHEVYKVADEHFTLEAEEDSDGEVDETAAEKKVKILMNTVVGMLSEWSDGRKVVVLDPLRVKENDQATSDVQLQLAADILERTLTAGCPGPEKKFLVTVLGKLYIPPPSASRSPTEFEAVGKLKDLLDEAIAEGIANDAAGRNTLVKVKNAVLKLVKEVTFADRKSTVEGGASEEDLQEEEDEETQAVAGAEEQSVIGDGDREEADEVEGRGEAKTVEAEMEATMMMESRDIEEEDDDGIL